MTARTVFASIVLALALATTATADPLVSKTGKVQIELPADWQVSTPAGDRVVIAADKTDEVGLFLVVADKSDQKAVLAALMQQLGSTATDLQWGKPKKQAINGMKGIVMDGTGTFGNDKALLSLALLKTKNKKGIAVLMAIKQGTEEAHAAEVLGIIKSLKPTK